MPVQAPDPMFPHALFPLYAVSLLPHWSVALPSSPFTPPQVVIMTGMILMSRLRALLRTDKEEKKKRRREKQSLPSPVYIACSLPHRFSQQVDGVEVSHPVTSQLSACLMAAQVSAPWIRLGSYWLADSLSLSNVAPVKGESARVCGQGGSDLNWIFAQMEINPKWTCRDFLLSPIFPFVNQSVFFP